MLKLSKTTSPQKLFLSDCITLYKVKDIQFMTLGYTFQNRDIVHKLFFYGSAIEEWGVKGVPLRKKNTFFTPKVPTARAGGGVTP